MSGAKIRAGEEAASGKRILSPPAKWTTRKERARNQVTGVVWEEASKDASPGLGSMAEAHFLELSSFTSLSLSKPVMAFITVYLFRICREYSIT